MVLIIIVVDEERVDDQLPLLMGRRQILRLLHRHCHHPHILDIRAHVAVEVAHSHHLQQGPAVVKLNK